MEFPENEPSDEASTPSANPTQQAPSSLPPTEDEDEDKEELVVLFSRAPYNNDPSTSNRVELTRIHCLAGTFNQIHKYENNVPELLTTSRSTNTSLPNSEIDLTTLVHKDDKTTEYKRMTRRLLKGKPLELEEIEMCRNKIKLMSESISSLESIVEQVKWCLEASLDSLFYEYRGGERGCTNKAYFLQLVIRSIDVWASDKSSFKRKFVLTNEELVKKTRELETAINTVMRLFLQCQKDLKTLDHALKIHPEIVKFRHMVPFKIIHKPFEKSPSDSDDDDEEEEEVIPSCQEDHADNEGDDDDDEFCLRSNKNRKKNNNQEHLVITFQDFKMRFIVVNNKNKENGAQQNNGAVLLKDLADDCQVEIICIPLRQKIRCISKAIYNIRMAQGHLESLKICELWEIIIPPSIKTPFFNCLENVVLAILVNSASGSVYTISPLLMDLETSVGHVSWLVRLLQLHAEAKKLIEKKKETTRKKFKWEDIIGLKWIQRGLTRNSSLNDGADGEIPQEFEIWDQPITREYTSIINKGMMQRQDIHKNLTNFLNRPIIANNETNK